MDNQTRVLLDAYIDHIAKLNGVADAGKKFNIAPSVQQKLEKKVQESSVFLSAINILPVRDIKGQKLGLGVKGSVASRTNTSGTGRRIPQAMAALEKHDYECQKTDYDTYLDYTTLDTWAAFPEFAILLSQAIFEQCALDRMMIGFNGTSAAATTDRDANPRLEDVNIGWLQQYRINAPARVYSEKVPGSGKITVGPGGDYENMDALVYDAYQTLIDPWHIANPGLSVITGRDLVHDKYFPLVNGQDKPTEMIAADMIISAKRMGRLPLAQVPSMPDGTLFITPPKNLSIYYQKSARRRAVIDNPAQDRIDTFESSNDAFVIENYGAGCVIENIELI